VAAIPIPSGLSLRPLKNRAKFRSGCRSINVCDFQFGFEKQFFSFQNLMLVRFNSVFKKPKNQIFMDSAHPYRSKLPPPYFSLSNQHSPKGWKARGSFCLTEGRTYWCPILTPDLKCASLQKM